MATGWNAPKTEIKVDWGFQQKANQSPVRPIKTIPVQPSIDLLHDQADPRWAPQYRETKSHDLSVDELIAISSQKSKGLQIIEVTPRLLDPTEYACAISFDEILDTKGNVTLPGIQFPTVPGQYYKSVTFPLVGNFFKFEIMPARYEANTIGANRQNSRLQGYQVYEDYIYLNLGSTNGKTLKLKHGDVVRSYFDTIILTFPQAGPRFRITVGFNSEYGGKDYRLENLHIADAPTIQGGLNYLKPTPFSLTNTNANDSVFKIDDGMTNRKALIQAYPTTAEVFNSNQVLWITSISCSILASKNSNAALDIIPAEFGLELYNNQTSTTWKKLWSSQFNLDFTAAATVNVIKEFTISFDTPIRVQLAQYLALYAFGTMGSTSDTAAIYPRIAINGYSMGSLVFIANSQVPVCPRYSLDVQPYNVDAESGV